MWPSILEKDAPCQPVPCPSLRFLIAALPAPVRRALYSMSSTSMRVVSVTRQRSTVRDSLFFPHGEDGGKGGLRQVCRSQDRQRDPCLMSSRGPSFHNAMKFLKITCQIKEESGYEPLTAPKPHWLPTPSTTLPLPENLAHARALQTFSGGQFPGMGSGFLLDLPSLCSVNPLSGAVIPCFSLPTLITLHFPKQGR